MKKDYTDITVILDRSGSMSGIRQDTIGGLNSYIEDQKKLEGTCKFSLVQFDYAYEPNYIARDINEVEYLTLETYVPRGSTALLDAIGKTINAKGERLRKLEEGDRPEKVVVVIITDGYENASHEFTKPQIKELIEHQESKYNWEVIFLGANMDAVSEGATLGTKFDKSMTWDASADGVRAAYMSLSESTVGYRTGGSFAFTADQRSAAAGK